MNKLHLFVFVAFLGFVFGQEDEGQLDEFENEEVVNIPTTTTEEPLRLENEAGPTEFYFQNGNLPKFKMSVESGIELTLYKNGMEWDKFILDKRASGGIAGSRQLNRIEDELESGEKKLKRDDFTVNIYYKEPITGINGQRLSEGFGLEIKFERKGNSWKMNQLTVKDVQEGSSSYAVVHLEMGSKTIGGHAVEAPIGLSYGCYEGTFRSNTTMPTVGKIHFPGWKIQVFEVKRGKFGPMWECGELMSIGVWVGLIVTLGFAIICAWGFSMLASINTMDRFDDPKGKSIHIPQTVD